MIKFTLFLLGIALITNSLFDSAFAQTYNKRDLQRVDRQIKALDEEAKQCDKTIERAGKLVREYEDPKKHPEFREGVNCHLCDPEKDLCGGETYKVAGLNSESFRGERGRNSCKYLYDGLVRKFPGIEDIRQIEGVDVVCAESGIHKCGPIAKEVAIRAQKDAQTHCEERMAEIDERLSELRDKREEILSLCEDCGRGRQISDNLRKDPVPPATRGLKKDAGKDASGARTDNL